MLCFDIFTYPILCMLVHNYGGNKYIQYNTTRLPGPSSSPSACWSPQVIIQPDQPEMCYYSLALSSSVLSLLDKTKLQGSTLGWRMYWYKTIIMQMRSDHLYFERIIRFQNFRGPLCLKFIMRLSIWYGIQTAWWRSTYMRHCIW